MKYLPWLMFLIAAVGLYFQYKNFKNISDWYKGTPGSDNPPPLGGASRIP